jgi:aromatic-L-amino-acid decarboxylase
MPEGGAPLEGLLDFLFGEAAARSLNAVAPGFMAYVPGGGIFDAAIGDLIGATLNRYVGLSATAPVLAQIEANVVRWFAAIVGYPAAARGFLTTGGSLATLSAVVTARHPLLGEQVLDGILYTGEHAHLCVAKAARLAGLPVANVRTIGSDVRYRLDPERLRVQIERDRALGARPFMVAAAAGTTNTGALDPLPELAALCAEENLWLHVDGAYGGLFALTSRGRERLAGIEQADSIVLDPHKTLFLPYGTGALLVKDGRKLKAAHSAALARGAGADYLPPLADDDAVVDFCDISPELTRPMRGLRIWLPLKLHGAAAFRAQLDEKLDLAHDLYARLARLPELELLCEPELSIFAFTLRKGTRTIEQRNTATRRLLAAINARQRVALSGTKLGEVFAIRVAIGSYRTHAEHTNWLFEDLCAALAET